jgi:hypothetical protein
MRELVAADQRLTDTDDTGRLAGLMRKETTAFAALLGLLLM